MKNRVLAVLAALVLLLAPGLASAQVNSSNQTVSLNLSVTSSISLSATPGSITFTYNSGAGTASASGPITVTGSYNLGSESNVTVWAWLGSTTAALSTGTNNIPASSVFAAINGGSASACTNSAASMIGSSHVNGAVDGAICPAVYLNQSLSSSQGNIPSTSVLLSLQSIPNLKAGSYTGVLSLQAAAW